MVKCGKLHLESGDRDGFEATLKQLYTACLTDEGQPDASKATMLLEVYCLEIQFCRVTENMTRLKRIYPKTLDLDGKSDI